jgi:hypothetical protein
MGIVHLADPLWNGKCPELAVIEAIATSDTHVGVHHGPEVGVGDGGWNPELSHTPHHPTATSAAVTYIEVPIAMVGGRVHQARFFGLTQYAQRVLFGDGPSRLAPVESTLNRSKNQTVLGRSLTSLAYQPLLNTANAITYSP